MISRVFDTAQLGTLIRQERKAQGVTQQQMAALFSGFSREFLSDLENGKPTAELGKALLVANALGLRVYLATGDEEIRCS